VDDGRTYIKLLKESRVARALENDYKNQAQPTNIFAVNKQLFWTGQVYQSSERCSIASSASGIEINSIVKGKWNDIPFDVKYFIKTNPNWETIYFELQTSMEGSVQKIQYQSDGKGVWTSNESVLDHLAGCIDIDISVTPLTNTLPLKRLKMVGNQSELIKVLYVDVLENSISSKQQKYTRITGTMYKFENVPNDFESTITVDNDGYVVDYPGLFEKTDV
jgi:hypothetical protein